MDRITFPIQVFAVSRRAVEQHLILRVIDVGELLRVQVVDRLAEDLGHAAAEEALERLAIEPFDVVLMDVYMPDMDGRQATRELRAMKGPNQQVPVIAITASATARDWEACLAAGMTGHVAKPIEPAQLYAALETALSGVQRAAAA